jgi:hypothetical protein
MIASLNAHAARAAKAGADASSPKTTALRDDGASFEDSLEEAEGPESDHEMAVKCGEAGVLATLVAQPAPFAIDVPHASIVDAAPVTSDAEVPSIRLPGPIPQLVTIDASPASTSSPMAPPPTPTPTPTPTPSIARHAPQIAAASAKAEQRPTRVDGKAPTARELARDVTRTEPTVSAEPSPKTKSAPLDKEPARAAREPAAPEAPAPPKTTEAAPPAPTPVAPPTAELPPTVNEPATVKAPTPTSTTRGDGELHASVRDAEAVAHRRVLKTEAHGEIRLPDLGKFEVRAAVVATEVHVHVRAEEPRAAALLSAHAAELGTEVRAVAPQASVFIGGSSNAALGYAKDDARGNARGDAREQRHESDESDTKTPRRTPGTRVRFVL